MIGETMILKLVSNKDLFGWNHWNKAWGKWCHAFGKKLTNVPHLLLPNPGKEALWFFSPKGSKKTQMHIQHHTTAAKKAINEWINQSMNQWINQSMNQPVQLITNPMNPSLQTTEVAVAQFRTPFSRRLRTPGLCCGLKGDAGISCGISFRWVQTNLAALMPFSARHGQLMVAIFCQDTTQNFQPTSLF